MVFSGTAYVNFRKDGDDGDDGRGIAEQITYWAISASSVTAPTYPSDPATAPSTSVWSTTAQTPTAAKPYVWTYTRIHWTSGTAWTMTTPAVIALRGYDGARLRGIYAFSSLASSYTLYSGTNGEEWYDVVKYGSYYWKVAVTGTVSTLGTPSASNSNYKQYTTFQFMATNSLVADSIVMEKNGVVLFRAEDGNVECKTGVFENVEVSGNITAKTLNLGFGTGDTEAASLFCLPNLGSDELVFPALEEGSSREYTLWYPAMTRNPGDKTIKGADSSVLFYENPAATNSATSLTISNGVIKKLIGLRFTNNANTYYILCE
jgi:hypothetical protein